MRNLITDVPGLWSATPHDAKLASGTTAIVFDEPAVASVDVRGGAPGTRDTELLPPEETVERVDAIVLSGGSAFGLDAPGGVQAWLREQGRGFAIGAVRVPIVPGAIVFDLLNGGDKDWGRFPPYRDLGYAAAASASARLRARHGGRGLWRHHGQSEGRARLGLGADARRRDRRRDRRRQCGRQRRRSVTVRTSGRHRSSATQSSADCGLPPTAAA